MKTQISNSLKDNMSSIQLKLNDFGLKDPIKKNTEELFKTKNTRPINQEYVYLNDNHFEYDNPTCSHCHKKHEKHKVIKKGFRTRKVRTTNKTKITIFLRRYQCKTCGKKFQTELSWLYDKNKRYTKQFFELIDKIMEFRNIPLSLLQHIINVVLNTNINLQTLEFWIKIKNKFSRNKEYLKIELIKDKNMIINHNIIGSGIYNYDEQYIKINGKKYYRLTLYDYSKDQPIAEQIIKKEWNKKSLSSKTIEEFIKTATKERPFKALITDGKKQYNEIAKKLRVQHQTCIFHAIKYIKDETKKYLRSKTLSTLDKITIANQTSQICQIYRELSLYDTYKTLNELKDIENQLLKPIKKILNTTVENNINKIITHHLYSEIPRTNNAVEQYYRNSLPKSKKNKKRTIDGVLTTLATEMMKKFKNTKEK